MKEQILAFLLGSSIICTIITFTYNGLAFRNSGNRKDIPYELIPILVCVLFGFSNMIGYILGLNWFMYFVLGAITGILFSLIGRFGFALPTKMFGFESDKQYIVHIVAAFLYSAIFGFIVFPVTNFYITK